MNASTRVSEIMTSDIIVVKPDTIVSVIRDIFESKPIHHIPVVHHEHLVGMVSKTDFYKISHCVGLFNNSADNAYNEDIYSSLLAKEIMSAHTDTLGPDSSLSEAALMFHKNKYHALPIVAHGKLVGILSTYDLIEHAYLKSIL